MKYVNLTPRWTEILPTWYHILLDAVKIKKPDQIDCFYGEIQRMARAADGYGDLLAGIGAQFDNTDMRDEYIKNLLKEGHEINELARNTIKEDENA